jgi:predicted peptidase
VVRSFLSSGQRGSAIMHAMTRRSFARCLAATTAVPLISQERIARLAPGAPESKERMALVDALRQQCEGLTARFEARTHKPVDGWSMPYRLFRPTPTGNGRLPLVVYLHGSGGLGNDNLKQISAGNMIGSHVWATAENQKRFPCYVAAPQTDRGWLRYDGPRPAGGGPPKALAGFGWGARAVMDMIEALLKGFPIDPRRVYVTGNSMGGGGSWHVVAHRGDLIAAAVPVCGSPSLEDGGASPGVSIWNFHGDADKTVPVEVSRKRIEERRKAGAKPLSTEYPGVGHNVTLWAYSEPALPEWLFAQRKA